MAMRSSGLIDRQDVAAGIERLGDEFSATDRLGPASFVRFLAAPTHGADDRMRLARQASGAVTTFISALRGT